MSAPIQLVPQVPPSKDEIRRLRWPDDVPIRGIHVLAGVPCLWAALFIISLGIGFALGAVMLLSGNREVSPGILTAMVLVDAALTVGFLVVLLIMNGRADFFSSYRLRISSMGYVVFALIVGVALAGIYQVLARSVWPYDQLKDSFNLSAGRPIDLLLFTLMALVAAVVEELYYRGLIFPVLRRWIGVAGAMAIVTAWFSAMHLFSYYRAPLAMAAVTALGLLAVMLRHFSRSVAPAIAVHLAYNGAVVLAVWVLGV